MMTILTTTAGQKNLPRYFSAAYAVAKRLKQGRLDFVMPDGRRFRIEGASAGPVAPPGKLKCEGPVGKAETKRAKWTGDAGRR